MTAMESTTLANREAIEGFVEEALDSLVGLPNHLQAYRLMPAETAPVHAVFRAIHSMKGCAAFLDLNAIRTFSHELENVLGAVRDETCSLSEELERSFVEAFDRLSEMLQGAVQGNARRELDTQQKELLEKIKQLAFQSPGRKPADVLLCEELLTLAEDMGKNEKGTSETWSKTLRTLVDSYLAEEDSEQAASSEAPPTLQPTDFLSARCFCGEEEVSDAVGAIARTFVTAQKEGPAGRTDSLLLQHVQSLAERLEGAGDPDAGKRLIHAAADLKMIVDSPIDLDENLLDLIWEQLTPELACLRATPQVPTETQNLPSKQADPAQTPPAECSEPGKTRSRFVRVKEDRLDEFLEYVSRLFIASERFKDVHSRMAASGQLGELVDEIQGIITDLKADSTSLQHGVMGLRRVSIAGLFSKFPRMARNLASNLGKQIAVHVSGEDTEIDKALAEDLDSPLTHLIRNVVDHGIESPKERLERGVPETGNFWLSAQQTRNHVKITVKDDGRGIDSDRLRAKAVEKGLLSQAQAEALSDEDALELIFHPGFSTAEKVSEVSGRGVGMDVVRTTLAEHGGEVHIESKLGVGTTFELVVPIRQATMVIDGLMVTEGDKQFVIPFDNLREIREISGDQMQWAHGCPVVKVRETVYDAVRLGQVLAMPFPDPPPNGKQMSALVHSKEGAFCLLVDQILGHRQVVVSHLKELLPCAEKIAGVAQLGGGRLALVLNIPEMAKDLQSGGSSSLAS